MLKKGKLDKSPNQLEPSQVLLWNMLDAAKKQKDRETISVIREFENASIVIVEDVIVEFNKKETKIKNLENKNIELESNAAQQLDVMKEKLDGEKAPSEKDIEDTNRFEIL